MSGKTEKQSRPYPDLGYTGQMGFYSYVLTYSTNKQVLQIECKCLLREVHNYIQKQSREQDVLEVKASFPFLPGASLTVCQGVAYPVTFF